jgi:aspartate/methionine/tyrosine aminotransferase
MAAVAKRLASIQPFHVMALLGRARELEAQGRSIIHMEIGEPDFTTPEPVIRAGMRALEQGRTHYTPSVGLSELRQTIADSYRDRFGVLIDPGRIVVTPGSSGALQLILACLVDSGSQVLMADPGYPCNRNFVYLFEGEPVGIPVGAQQHYQLSAQLIEQYWTESTRAALIATPSNPTGTVIPQSELQALLDVVRQRNGYLIVDEIYQNLCYATSPRTALSLGDDIFVINSFSKYFGMTGWRLGWLVAPTSFIGYLDALAQNLFLSAPTVAQYAALAAFGPESLEILEQRRMEFQSRRDFLLPALRELGFEIDVEPEGAFYLYADCSRLTDDSSSFAAGLLDKAGVAITPGLDFGQYQASSHVRFAYTTSIEQLEQGVERIRTYLNGS